MIKKGIIVGININNKNNFDESMEELKNLCLACKIETVGQIKQNSKKVNSTFYMGSGKIDELKNLVEENNADIVIFNNELSASQVKNIEEEINCNVIDRTALILDIFANRAKTRESKLQVEVAKLQYELPRLVGSNEDLGRQSGGVGTKNRGAGETKLELDRRRIEDKIANLNKELEVLKNQREVQKSKRKKSNIPNVALVGYTNAGKSSVMNALVEKFINDEDKKVFEKNFFTVSKDVYASVNDLLDENKRKNGIQKEEKQEINFVEEQDVFQNLIGSNGSLKNPIEQMKTSIFYPNTSLPVFLHGPTGSGKSFMARKIYEFAVQEGILKPDAPFIIGK